MSDYEILRRWLAKVAARISWNRRVQVLGRSACVLISIWLFIECVEVFPVPRSILTAVYFSCGIVAVAVAVVLAVRLVQPTPLEQAAWASDARACLNDELKSAQWFARLAGRDAFVDLQIKRAAVTARSLNARLLFPIPMPRSALIALSLVLMAGALAWFSPRVSVSSVQALLDQSGELAQMNDGQTVEDVAPNVSGSQSAKLDELASAWSDMERLTNELPAGSGKDAMKKAVAARDASLTAQLLKSLERSQPSDAPRDKFSPPGGRLQPAASRQRLLEAMERLSDEKQSERPIEPPTKAEISPTVRTATQQLRAQAREERRKITGTPAQGEVTPNNQLRAVSRAGAGMREVAYGEGEAADAGSRASVSGAATGERTGRSQAGGSEGESPNSGEAGPGDDEPVLGTRTERLVGRLEKMGEEHEANLKQQELEEEFFAATQHRTAQLAYDDIVTQWSLQREVAIAPGEIPIPYRNAVKQYLLSQHAKEE